MVDGYRGTTELGPAPKGEPRLAATYATVGDSVSMSVDCFVTEISERRVSSGRVMRTLTLFASSNTEEGVVLQIPWNGSWPIPGDFRHKKCRLTLELPAFPTKAEIEAQIVVASNERAKLADKIHKLQALL